MVHWLDRKSRMKREFHVRFCERLEGWFLWSTRQLLQTQTKLTIAGYAGPLGLKNSKTIKAIQIIFMFLTRGRYK